MEEKGATGAPSLPKGGGAIQGIGETFQPNLFSGTGNFSVPIPTTPGRGGFGPQLGLQYSSGNGNGPFGLGWDLSVPRITRKTEKGLPRYNDRDVFVMSGAEDLVPKLDLLPDEATSPGYDADREIDAARCPEESENVPSGWRLDSFPWGSYQVMRFRPRTEGLFARIERWTDDKGDVHWRATTRDNITSVYGRSRQARIMSPADPEEGLPERVFEWLLEETFDAKGNHILYEYAAESPDLAIHGIHEQHREYGTQRYLRRILYGNTPSTLVTARMGLPRREGINHDYDPADGDSKELIRREYVFEVLFDFDPSDREAAPEAAYLGHDGATQEILDPSLQPRPDSFSTFRPGFEVRTLRRCERVLMFHHFEELAGSTLVKSTSFEYDEDPNTRLSLLIGVHVTGYRRTETGAPVYQAAGMPPVSFGYSRFEPHKQRYQSVTAKGNALPVRSLKQPDMALVDVYGDGLPDLLETTPGGYRHWRNLGDGRLERPHLQHGPVPTMAFT